MNDFVIITDSGCDLPASMAEEMGIIVLPLSVVIKGKEYFNYLDGREISFPDFYSILRSGESGTTSGVNVGGFIQAMEPVLKEGKDILYMGFSAALSLTYSASVAAAAELSEKYPERKIYTVDTRCASLGQGLLVWYAVQEKNKGRSVDEVAKYVEDNKLKLCHWFTVEDLDFLRRGGRISSATAVLGTMLSIKPVLHVDNEGRLINVGKSRGRKQSLKALVDHMEATAIDPANQTVFISHGDSEADALTVKAMVEERFGTKSFVINYVGPVIGNHSGPGTIALFFMGSER